MSDSGEHQSQSYTSDLYNSQTEEEYESQRSSGLNRPNTDENQDDLMEVYSPVGSSHRPDFQKRDEFASSSEEKRYSEMNRREKGENPEEVSENERRSENTILADGGNPKYSDSQPNQQNEETSTENRGANNFGDEKEVDEDNLSVNSHLDFPEYANERNKELHQLILEKKKELRQIAELTEDVRERHRVMNEHLSNIKSEIQHAQVTNENKQKEIDSENHYNLLLQRQLGKLQKELKSADTKVSEMREKLNEAQKKVFENNQKIEKIRLEINWNREEMDQWLAGARQKEEDRLVIEKFQRADESKIKELNLNIEKLTSSKAKLESELAKEVTETQALQIQINRMAEEFRKETEDRHRLYGQWEALFNTIEEKNVMALNAGHKMEACKTANAAKQEQLLELRKILKKVNQENLAHQDSMQKLERAIYQRKNDVKGLKETEKNSKAEMKILQNRISAFSSELERKRSLLMTLGNDLTTKQKRLTVVESRFHRQMQIFQNNQSTEKELERMMTSCEAELKKAEKDMSDFLKHLSSKKHEFYQAQKELYKCKQSQSNLLAETSGLTTKIKNLASHSAKLFVEIQKQQELLYNAEYQIQLLERKVARAQGEKTIEETDYLIEKIRLAKEEHSKVNRKYQATVTAMKNLSDEHRTLDKKIKALEEEEKKLTVLIDKINLENDMTAADLANIIAKKEEVLVQNNVMKLELEKIQVKVIGSQNEVLELQSAKTQLEAVMTQREKEVTLHQSVLQAEYKLAEQERHRTAIELSDRRNKVKNLQIKYQSLIQSKQGSVDIYEHSQAYYIIKSAQEKEELQRKQEELKAQISKAEFEVKALENTLNHLQGRNTKLREYQLNKNATQADFDLKRNLQEQFHAIGNRLVEKKSELESLKQACENGQQYLSENSKKLEMLKMRRKEMMNAAANCKVEEREYSDKLERALKSVTNNGRLLEKKKLKFDETSFEFWDCRSLSLDSFHKTAISLVA